MTSDLIVERANAQITSGMVIERMIALMSQLPESVPTESMSWRIAEHKRRATWSSCMCPYCAPIKAYVSLKLLMRRIERQFDNAPTGAMRDRLDMLTSQLPAAIVNKDRAKMLDISAYVGSESS